MHVIKNIKYSHNDDNDDDDKFDKENDNFKCIV
jgi:hypothetical protein